MESTGRIVSVADPGSRTIQGGRIDIAKGNLEIDDSTIVTVGRLSIGSTASIVLMAKLSIQNCLVAADGKITNSGTVVLVGGQFFVSSPSTQIQGNPLILNNVVMALSAGSGSLTIQCTGNELAAGTNIAKGWTLTLEGGGLCAGNARFTLDADANNSGTMNLASDSTTVQRHSMPTVTPWPIEASSTPSRVQVVELSQAMSRTQTVVGSTSTPTPRLLRHRPPEPGRSPTART